MPYNPNKTITANSKGIIISFRDDNKPKYIPYKNKEVDNLQHLGRSLYQTFDLPAFNKIQQKLYAEALYGINAYDQSEIMTLTHKDILRITALHRRVQFFLNRWKQEIMDCKVDALLSKLFPHSKVVKDSNGETQLILSPEDELERMLLNKLLNSGPVEFQLISQPVGVLGKSVKDAMIIRPKTNYVSDTDKTETL